MFDYTGKVVAVTGASSGLGKQMAEGYAGQGANLVLLARRVERLEASAAEWAEKYGIEVLPCACDVTDEASIDAALAAVDEKFGHIETLVNCAGGEKGTGTQLVDFVRSDWDFTMNLDLTSVFTMTKKVAGYMKANIEAGKQSYGRIINIASMYGLVGNKIAGSAPYHAAKGGVVNLTRALAAEWGKYGITVNSICPGYFYTPLTQETLDSDFFQQNAKTMIPEERYGNEGELDSAAIFLAAPSSSYVTGVQLPVDGGYTCM
jgi:gluconate 5-dehydrogenase